MAKRMTDETTVINGSGYPAPFDLRAPLEAERLGDARDSRIWSELCAAAGACRVSALAFGGGYSSLSEGEVCCDDAGENYGLGDCAGFRRGQVTYH